MRSKCDNITIEELINILMKRYTTEQRKKLKVYVANNEELDHIFESFYIDTDTENDFMTIAPIFDKEVE